MIYYFIGKFNIKLIENFKETKAYGIEGYKISLSIIRYFNKIITSSHILTEISNLSNKLNFNVKADYFHQFFSKLTTLEELMFPAKEIEPYEPVKKFGLTDSMIYYLSKNKNYLVLTDDYPLAGYLTSQGIDVINFNHLYDYRLEGNKF